MKSYQTAELNLFKQVQKLAYEAVVHVRTQLYEGITEKEAAHLIDVYLKKKGVDRFFHYGFAWFGDRTAFQNFKKPLVLPNEWIENLSPPHFGLEFLPSDRRLKKGMPVILDVAPILNDCAADVGYAFAFGENPQVEKALMDLEIFRTEILNLVLAEKTMSEIYLHSNRIIQELGYVNCHALYPQGVLGHKVGRIPFNWLPPTWIMGFSFPTFFYIGQQFVEKLFNDSKISIPLWNEKINSPPSAGLWAVEPHIGKDGIGVKWEEILVITESTAYWLDDDLPHVQFWNKHRAVKS